MYRTSTSSNPINSFGSIMEGRNYEGDTSLRYRFGFNGKEKDDEVYGDGHEFDFGARIYDSRLGRFLSLDPLSRKFAHKSPYLAMDNNPLSFIDKGGDSTAYYTASGFLLFWSNDSRPDAIVIIPDDKVFEFNFRLSQAIANNTDPENPKDNQGVDEFRKMGKVYKLALFKDLYTRSMKKNNLTKGRQNGPDEQIICTDENGKPLHNEIGFNLQDVNGEIVKLGEDYIGDFEGVNIPKGVSGTVASAHSHTETNITYIRKIITRVLGPLGYFNKTKQEKGYAGSGPSEGTGDIGNCRALEGYLSVVAQKDGLYFYDKKKTVIEFKNFRHAPRKPK